MHVQVYTHKDAICAVKTSALDGRPTAEVTRLTLPSETGFTNATQAAIVVAASQPLIVATSRSCFAVFLADERSPSPVPLSEFLSADGAAGSSGRKAAGTGGVFHKAATEIAAFVAGFTPTDVGVSPSDGTFEFFRGISVCPLSDQLLVGTSWGDIVQIEVAPPLPTASGPGRPILSYFGSLKGGHKSAITCIAADDRYIVSCDDAGSVCQWDAGGGKMLVRHDKGAGAPATCVALHGDLIIVGYASGHVRIFRCGDRYLEAEVCAHARPVTGLDLHPASPTFVTVGEDGIINVWSLHVVGTGPLGVPGTGTGTGRGRVVLDLSTRVPNAVLTGVAFVCPAGSAKGKAAGPVHIVATAYDSYVLTVLLGLR